MHRSLIVGTLVLLLLPTAAQAQEKEKAWWNPLSLLPTANDSRSSDFFNKPKKSSGSFLGMTKPAWMKSEAKPKSGTSSMQRFGQSTKKLWSDTADFINPFDKKPTPSPYMGKNVGFQSQKQDKPSSGGFGWLWPKEEVEQPQTINDWLGQSNPLTDTKSY